MARILSHPFRLLPNGAVATVEQESDLADAEQIAVMALTVRGERPLVPGFGVTDPAYGGFDAGELVAGLAVYGPPRTIVATPIRWATDAEQVVDVIFD